MSTRAGRAPMPLPAFRSADLLHSMIDAVLLEFENVLAVTGDARRDALRASLADEGIGLDDTVYDEQCAGLATREAVVAAATALGIALDPTAVALAVMRAERTFAGRLGKGILLAPGAREFVEHVHGRARLALVTRASRREVEFVLGLAGLGAAFECVVTSDDVHESKPSPAGYLEAFARMARRRAISPAQSVALEDSLPGIRAARAAGTSCVAVGAVPVYRAASADAYVTSLSGHTIQSLTRLVTHGQERVTHE